MTATRFTKYPQHQERNVPSVTQSKFKPQITFYSELRVLQLENCFLLHFFQRPAFIYLLRSSHFSCSFTFPPHFLRCVTDLTSNKFLNPNEIYTDFGIFTLISPCKAEESPVLIRTLSYIRSFITTCSSVSY